MKCNVIIVTQHNPSNSSFRPVFESPVYLDPRLM